VIANNIYSNQESLWAHGAATVATWTANRAIYIPFHAEVAHTIKRIAFYTGTTITGNIDVGLYDMDGTRRVSSGSTALVGTSQGQVIDITDESLSAGRYYMAMALSAADSMRVLVIGNSAPLAGMLGVKYENSAFPLPATATFADPGSTDTVVPQMALLIDA